MTALEDTGGLDVRVVGPGDRSGNTAQTPGGLHRFEAVSSALTGSQRMWMGYAVLDPGGRTGVHHHGEMIVARSTQEAIVVPVEGHPHAPDHAR